MSDKPPDTRAELRQRADELCQRASEIASDVSALTRELYSPKLELLEIIPAMRGFGEELVSHQKLTVDFRHGDIPSRLPRDDSLCLFRVLQEGLRNAVKHGGVERLEVRLQALPGAIQLTMRDRGGDSNRKRRGAGWGWSACGKEWAW